MSEIEKVLEQNMEEYESARRRARKLINGYRREISRTYEYADALVQMPVNPDRIFFLWESGTGDGSLVQEIYEYVKKTYGKKYTCICCVEGGMSFGAAGRVRQKSPGYWRALASSGFIISSLEMPAAFVKRKGQIYFNTMSGIHEKKRLDTKKFVSQTVRDMLKTDFIYAFDASSARKTWKEKCLAGNVYDGKVLILSEEIKEKAVVLGRYLLEGRTAEGLEALSFREGEKKKILLLGNSLAAGNTKLILHRILEQMNPMEYDVAFYGEELECEEQYKEFLEEWPGVTVLTGCKKMTVGEEEYLDYLTAEKNPEMYLEIPAVRKLMNGLAKREWNRLFGTAPWDVVIAAGCTKYQPYYLAASAEAKKKILVDLDFLPYIHEKYPVRWRRAITVFDRIYAPAHCQQLGNYGQENRLRVMRLPVLTDQKPKGDEVELVSYQEKEYLVCGRKKESGEHFSMTLVRKPERGSILVSADLPPSLQRKEMLLKLAKTHHIYLLGTETSGYTEFLPDAVVLDEYVRNELYLLPEAWEFFCGFEGYVGNPSLEYDVTEKICKAFGVKGKV